MTVDGGGRRGSFWNSMAGMMTAIAALITALVGVLAFVHGIESQPSTSPPESSPLESTGSMASPSPTSTESTAQPGALVTLQSPLLFDNDGVDLDSESPNDGSTSGVDIYSGGTSVQTFGDVQVTSWTGQVDPSYDTCASRLDTFGTESIDIDTGSRVCIRTSQDRIAIMTVLRQSDDGSSSWEVDVTVWRRTG